MNKLFKLLTLLTVIAPTVQAQPNQWGYFKYLPKESIIPAKCEQSRSWFLKNRVEVSCDALNKIFKVIAEGRSDNDILLDTLSVGLQDRLLRETVKIILENESEKTKWNEYDYVRKTAEKISKNRRPNKFN